MSATAPAAVAVAGLTKSYQGHEAVRGIDLCVERGEVFCLLGPNGAGKTTTVEILEGFRRRSGGDVRVLGFDPGGQPLELRRRIGVVPQECALPLELRVDELVDAYRECYPAPRPRDELLQVVELVDARRTLVRNLSGGQQRRLDLALALAGDPDLVFLDEPTTGFDPAARRRCWGAIRNLAALDKTVLLTTHYLDEASELADRVGIVVDGRVVADDTPRRLAALPVAPTRIDFELLDEGDRMRLPPLCGELGGRGRWVDLRTSEPDRALYDLLSWARGREMPLTRLAVRPPTLEDVYLHLVGAQ